ncbi:phosphatidylglycerol / phosphatidylinositol transfer protein [Gigaspora margarita]|uniref:Phosphatidylglycerol/phosphatidylinositol transfer protein n=1 Tax=Gigaspora margarita TaxID=4874 RepID=A0A8H3XAH9_GIGMA|nr:phosphatidylglycerol / phosphatidylinositol transfer protein [Gigaspora margarita]
MNKFFAIIIFLTLVTFTTSFPLSGFTQCTGTFPNEVTSFSFSPNPIIAGQNVTYTISVDNTVTVQHGATFNITTYKQQQVIFNVVSDYCKNLIEGGYECPLEPGNYTFVFSDYMMTTPYDPKNTTIEFDSRTEIANPGDPKTILTCIERKYSVYYP